MNVSKDNLRVFAGSSHPTLAAEVACQLGVPLGELLLTRFSDGEIRVQVEESARGMDVFLVQPTSFPVNESLMELLILIDAFRRASASRITCVLPYYGYARQDKKIKPREPVTARLVADLLTEAGANRVVCLDLHAQQIQGFFRLPVDHLYAGPLIGRYLMDSGLAGEGTCVVSPDEGGVRRALAMAEMLGSPLATIAKRRPAPNMVEVVEIIGDVRGKRCILIDDMIDTGGSIAHGATALLSRGAKSVIACCTHPVFSPGVLDRFAASPLEAVVTTNSIPLRDIDHPWSDHLTVLSVAPLLADAIRRIHHDDSVSALFDRQW
ncbi:MAG: ribose-phosphate diphosphokinase [Armatimonadaceae bacterium]